MAQPIETLSSAQQLTMRSELGFNGVRVTHDDGSFECFAPTADTDTARGLALEAAMLVAVAGDTVDLSPGSYYVAKATSTIAGVVGQYAILDKMTIRLNGAYLWKQNTDTASVMFTPNAATGINDWSIIGPGTIEGSYLDTANTTGARGAAAAEIAINISSCRRWRVQDLTIKNLAGTGLQINNAVFAVDEYSIYKISTGHVENCNIDRNNLGCYIGSLNEYNIIKGCTFNMNQTGIDSYAGNTHFSGCHVVANVNYGMRIRNGNNDGHGCFIGGWFTHNTGFSVAAEASMDNGFLFNGTTFAADSNTTNKIQSLGGGVTLDGCYVDSPFHASGTPTGINVMKNCFIAGTYTVITDLSAAERAKWKFQNNHTLTGVWASDDIRTTYADDTAAGTGGVLTGELWQSSTTPGAVFVKL